MLIAMMANTYQSISDRSEKEWRRQWAQIIMVLERSVKPSELKRLQDDYSVNMTKEGSNERRRGLVVIKKSSLPSKADKRRTAISNWQILGIDSIKNKLKQQATKSQLPAVTTWSSRKSELTNMLHRGHARWWAWHMRFTRGNIQKRKNLLRGNMKLRFKISTGRTRRVTNHKKIWVRHSETN